MLKIYTLTDGEYSNCILYFTIQGRIWGQLYGTWSAFVRIFC